MIVVFYMGSLNKNQPFSYTNYITTMFAKTVFVLKGKRTFNLFYYLVCTVMNKVLALFYSQLPGLFNNIYKSLEGKRS